MITAPPNTNPARSAIALIATGVAAAALCAACQSAAGTQRPLVGVLAGDATQPIDRTPLVSIATPELEQVLSFDAPTVQSTDGTVQVELVVTNTRPYRHTFDYLVVFYDEAGRPLDTQPVAGHLVLDPDSPTAIAATGSTPPAVDARVHIAWAER